MTHKTASQLVAEAKATVENVTPDQVQAEMAAGAVLVDVRDAAERAAGAIPGSLHASRGMLEFHADPSSPLHKPELDPNRRVIEPARSDLDILHATFEAGIGQWRDAQPRNLQLWNAVKAEIAKLRSGD